MNDLKLDLISVVIDSIYEAGNVTKVTINAWRHNHYASRSLRSTTIDYDILLRIVVNGLLCRVGIMGRKNDSQSSEEDTRELNVK